MAIGMFVSIRIYWSIYDIHIVNFRVTIIAFVYEHVSRHSIIFACFERYKIAGSEQEFDIDGGEQELAASSW